MSKKSKKQQKKLPNDPAKKEFEKSLKEMQEFNKLLQPSITQYRPDQSIFTFIDSFMNDPFITKEQLLKIADFCKNND